MSLEDPNGEELEEIAGEIAEEMGEEIIDFRRSEEQIITLYPNPANEYFNLTFSKPLSGTIQIVGAASGKIEKIESVTIETEVRIDISSLAKGFYLIYIVGEDKRETKKLIKR
jgi:hypothetical protein